MRSASAKRITLEALKAKRAGFRAAKESLVFANGVFDLLHVGHLRYLEEARSLGSYLVVAINSDRSTRAIKGDGRPVIPEDERAELIAGFECVDFVLLFDDPDVRRLLAELQPDVHAKGTDYTPETVPERDVVLAYGGRVAICGDEKTHSSTELIERRN